MLVSDHQHGVVMKNPLELLTFCPLIKGVFSVYKEKVITFIVLVQAEAISLILHVCRKSHVSTLPDFCSFTKKLLAIN